MTDPATLLTFADLALDQSAHAVTRGRREIQLTVTEYRLLEALMLRPGQVLTPRQLAVLLPDTPAASGPQAVRTHLCRLRAKLEAAGEARLVQTVHGTGFVLRSGGGA